MMVRNILVGLLALGLMTAFPATVQGAAEELQGFEFDYDSQEQAPAVNLPATLQTPPPQPAPAPAAKDVPAPTLAPAAAQTPAPASSDEDLLNTLFTSEPAVPPAAAPAQTKKPEPKAAAPAPVEKTAVAPPPSAPPLPPLVDTPDAKVYRSEPQAPARRAGRDQSIQTDRKPVSDARGRALRPGGSVYPVARGRTVADYRFWELATENWSRVPGAYRHQPRPALIPDRPLR